MTSERKTEANRRNARRSTGPKTSAGKAASSRNALRHGLRARQIVLEHEDQSAFIELLRNLEAGLAPEGPHEEHLVLQMASAQWRLLRLARMEYGFLMQLVRLGRGSIPDASRLAKDEAYAEFSRALGLGLGTCVALGPLTYINRCQSTLARTFNRSLDEFYRSRAARQPAPPDAAPPSNPGPAARPSTPRPAKPFLPNEASSPLEARADRRPTPPRPEHRLAPRCAPPSNAGPQPDRPRLSPQDRFLPDEATKQLQAPARIEAADSVT